MNPLYQGAATTIFEEMSGLARAHGAINLGQGFPDTDGPEDIRRAAADAMLTQSSQYPPMRGLPVLREAVAEHYARLQGLPVSADDVLVTSGATEALAAAILALVSPGDEVVLIQPMYDAYLPLVRQAGGVPRFLTLERPGFRLTADAIASAFTPRTRLVLVNSPLNPAGRVLDADERALLAAACAAHDVIAICDEVWEHVVFDGHDHVPLMTLPGMAGRTVKIGSAGKMFSMTGWKVGFVVAPPGLLDGIAKAHQFLTFTTPPALQAGAAFGLAKPAAWFAAMRAGYQASRDVLRAALEREGFVTLPSEGTYFLCVDLIASGIAVPDRALCLALVQEAGVAAIPVSAFYAERAETGCIRLCFAKSDAVLLEGAARLGAHRRRLLA